MDDHDSNSENYDTSSLLLIERNGIITKAGCPFQVVCIQSIDELTEGSVYTVSDVIGTQEDYILFVIDGGLHSHTCFLLFHGLFPHQDYKFPNSDLPFWSRRLVLIQYHHTYHIYSSACQPVTILYTG